MQVSVQLHTHLKHNHATHHVETIPPKQEAQSISANSAIKYKLLHNERRIFGFHYMCDLMQQRHFEHPVSDIGHSI